MGKFILLLVILFGAYWAWQYYKAGSKQSKSSTKPEDIDDVDKLIQYYDEKIQEIESKSMEEIASAKLTLEHYKAQINKLNNLKNK